jgi:predicted nucleotidyltransferase
LYQPLVELLERTVGLEPALRRALANVEGVDAAFIHGSYAGGRAVKPTSDVDVLVIGSVDAHALRRSLRQVERAVGREIDVTAYTANEFAELARRGNSFANQIIRGPVRPLIGSTESLSGAA